MGRVNGVLMGEYFNESEFKHPEIMDKTFLLFLYQVRHISGVKMVLTNDGRTMEENTDLQSQGASPKSLHLLGRAVDFKWPKEKPWEEFYTLATACKAARDLMPTKYGIELELVLDGHVHLGLFLDGRPDRLVIARD